MSNNMYRVGDYVYFETFTSAPYQIRRIDELIKTSPTQIDAKVTCFYRRRDLPNSLLKIADQAERQDQILWRPRRCLLSRHPLDASTSNNDNNGDVVDGTAVNGISSSSGTKKFESTSSETSTTTTVTGAPTNSGDNNGDNNDLASNSSSAGEAANAKNGTKIETKDDKNLEELDAEQKVDETNLTDVKKENETTDEKKEDGKEEDNQDADEKKPERSFGFAGLPHGADKLPSGQVHALRQRELFLSRQSETVNTSHFRGKCAVEILNEVVTCDMYLDREDAFFYSLVYDPANQTLLADKGKIEIGPRHQADVPEWTGPPSDENEDDEETVNENKANSCVQNSNHQNFNANSIEEEIDKDNGELKMVEDVEGSENGDDNQQMDISHLPQTTSSRKRKRCGSKVGGVPVTDREFLVYHPYHSLTDRDIDQFLIIARAVGTFSRALDGSSTIRLPSLHITASAASRDVTLLHAMALLHQANYDIGQATKFLVPPPSKDHYPLDADKLTSHNTVSLGGPILCRDQLEEWSAAEATLFEEAIEKYSKDFYDIRADCLPWKSQRDIVEYYYMWKTTARYAEMDKGKLAEKEKQLKQVFVQKFNKTNPNMVHPVNQTQERVKSVTPCESCKATESLQWYHWGPAHLHLRLCADCWTIWKKRGGLKCEHELENYDLDGVNEATVQQQQNQQQQSVSSSRNANNSNRNSQNRSGLPTSNASARVNAGASSKPISGINNMNAHDLFQAAARHGVPNQLAQQLAAVMANSTHHQHQQQQQLVTGGARGRVTFYLDTSLQARIARRMAPKSILNVRKAARTPFVPIDGRAIQNYYYSRHINEIIRMARQLKRNRLMPASIDALQRLHNKYGSNNGAAPSIATGAAFPNAAAAAAFGAAGNGTNAAALAAAAAAILGARQR